MPASSGRVSNLGSLALSCCRRLRRRAAAPSTQGAVGCCIDAFVAVVPPDPIARRGVTAEHLLNDAGAWRPIRRLGLHHYTLANLEGHDHARAATIISQRVFWPQV